MSKSPDAAIIYWNQVLNSHPILSYIAGMRNTFVTICCAIILQESFLNPEMTIWTLQTVSVAPASIFSDATPFSKVTNCTFWHCWCKKLMLFGFFIQNSLPLCLLYRRNLLRLFCRIYPNNQCYRSSAPRYCSQGYNLTKQMKTFTTFEIRIGNGFFCPKMT